MEIEAKFRVADVATYRSLCTTDHLGTYQIQAGVVQAVHDSYLDSPDRRILASGHSCRMREANGDVMVTLKSVTPGEGAVHRREELEIRIPDVLPFSAWPKSPVRERVLGIVGGAPIRPIFDVRQRRRVRPILRSSDRAEVADMSLDAVTLQHEGRERRFYALEVELRGEGTEEDLHTLLEHLEGNRDLKPDTRSKFRRGLAFVGISWPHKEDPASQGAPAAFA
jgi:inorganic triphosphatase YgiF